MARYGCYINYYCNIFVDTMSIDLQEKIELWSKVLITIGTYIIVLEIAAANKWFGLL